ncbi:MAG: hypothetical protein AB8G77_08495 [Rhodothermales bacterium]
MSIHTSAPFSGGFAGSSAQQSLLPEKKKVRGLLLFTLWVAIGAYPVVEGLSYYTTPLIERPYSELHEQYKPSGFLGQGLGILGTLMMLVGVVSYMVRKRWAFLQRFGKLRNWLTFHIFLCTLGPFLVLLHTTFKFGNIASISFWSMAVVVGSGVFGRYVYVRIPKTVNGQFLSPQVIRQAQSNLVQRLSGLTKLPVAFIESLTASTKPSSSIFRAVLQSMTFEFRKRSMKRTFESSLAQNGVDPEGLKVAVPLLMNNAQLQIRAQVMQPFIRAFGYWHVLHIPLALVMLVALIIHIGVALAFGYTWVW